jgi:hypothetical protein
VAADGDFTYDDKNADTSTAGKLIDARPARG